MKKRKTSDLSKKVEKYFKDLFEIKKSPHSIALGFAIGTLIALLPTFGLGILVGLGILLIFKNISKISMLISFAFWNPFLLIPMFGLSYKIGDWVMKDLPIKDYEFSILTDILAYSRNFIIGNLILAISVSTLSYLIILYFTILYQRKQPIEKIIEIAGEIEEILSDGTTSTDLPKELKKD
jgi:uncharacterized protein